MASYRTFRGRPAITGNTDIGFKQSQANYPVAGFGQVEPNHLSAQRNGQIYAQLPMSKTIPMLENGQFVKYDYAAGCVDFATENTGEWMLVYNEVKVYREGDSDADFAMLNPNYDATGIAYKSNYTGSVYDPTGETHATHKSTFNVKGEETRDYTYGAGSVNESNPIVCPRVLKTMPGDIYTTNMINAGTSGETVVTPALGDLYSPNASGILTKYTASAETAEPDMIWRVVKVYTMPDLQPGVKLQRIK